MTKTPEQIVWEHHTRSDANVQRSAMQRLTGTREGRRLLWGLLDDAGYHANPFTGNALTTANNCGRLEMGHELMKRILAADPTAYIKMQEENLQLHDALKAKLAARQKDDDYEVDA